MMYSKPAFLGGIDIEDRLDRPKKVMTANIARTCTTIAIVKPRAIVAQPGIAIVVKKRTMMTARPSRLRHNIANPEVIKSLTKATSLKVAMAPRP
jgi:hypothetical protein